MLHAVCETHAAVSDMVALNVDEDMFHQQENIVLGFLRRTRID